MRGSEHALEWEEPERLEQEKAKQVDQHDDVKTCLSDEGCAGGGDRLGERECAVAAKYMFDASNLIPPLEGTATPVMMTPRSPRQWVEG